MNTLIRYFFFLLVFASSQVFTSSSVKENMKNTAPNPEKIPFLMQAHGVERMDNYHWMRDDSRKSKKIISHLKKENAYTEKWFKSDLDSRKELFDEIVSRVPRKEDSVPIRMGSFEYFRRYKPEKEHPIYVRRKSKNSKENVILDVNELASGSEFYQIANWSIAPSENIIAYAQDVSGRREYEIFFRDIDSQKESEISLKNTSGDMAWSADGNFFFYVLRHPETLLPYRLYRHSIGENQNLDELVYEERDDTFYLSVGNSRSKKYIELDISSSNSSEVRLIEADKPLSNLLVVLPREDDHIYSIEDDGDRFVILTNWKAKNFRIMESEISAVHKKNKWKELIKHNKDQLIQSFLTFPSNLVIKRRVKGLSQILIFDPQAKNQKTLKFNDPSYSLYLSANPEYETSKLNIGYSSLRVPDSIYSVSLKTARKALLKEAEVKGNFEKNNYLVKRLNIKVRDGTSVPVSLVYRKDKFVKGVNPLFIYGYGSYGQSIDASFSSTRLSLLDRGFVYAISHVRGGQELGRAWYEDGKMFKKKNTFYDFIDTTKELINLGFGSPNKVYAGGGSAGGLLMGAVINMEPELFKGIISNVPFVDVITTMSDPSIPLTTGEYEEWGNPENKDEFNYMLSYSPYDNIKALSYPAIFVTAGFWDSQVQYFEPAKYVAKLRDYSTSLNPIIMKMNLKAGHSGVSGRFASLNEVAMEYAFLLRLDKESE